MRTILVTGASGIVGYGILRSLRACRAGYRLIGTSIHDDSVAPAFCDACEVAPHTDDPGYIGWLLEAIRRQGVDLAIPGLEIDLFAWNQHREALAAAGARLLLNDARLIDACRDKWLFYARLREIDLPCRIDSALEGDFDTLAARFGLPFILKPRRGFGARGIVRVADAAGFAAHRAALGPSLMAQPIVGDDTEEYTTAAFGDGAGSYHACMTLRRKLARDGYTDKAEVVDSDDFAPTLAALCAAFSPAGPTNFQFRRCHDGIRLLEINPRISSATSIRTAFGYNESAMAASWVLEGRSPVQPVIRRGRAVRYVEDFILHDDRLHL